MQIARSLPLFVLLVGCGSPADEDVAQVEQAKRVKPSGQETFREGTLEVKLPALTPPNIERVAVQAVGASNHSVDAGSKADLPIGTYQLTLGSVVGSSFRPSGTLGAVTIVGGQTKVVDLAVIVARSEGPAAPTVGALPKLDFGIEPVGPSAAIQRVPLVRGTPYPLFSSTAGTRVVPVVPATYDIVRSRVDANGTSTGVENVGSVQALAGRVAEITGTWDWYVPNVAALPSFEVVMRLQRELPSQWAAHLDTQCPAGAQGNLRWNAVTESRGLPVGTQRWKAYRAPGCVHTMYTASGSKVIDSSSATTTLDIEAIDVEDVEVTHQNGTKRTVKGTYSVFALGTGSSTPLIQGRPTGTGIDVFPGSYRVVVKYTDNVGEKLKEMDVTIP